VIAFTSPYLWYTTRATGMVTLVLFTLVVALGTLVSNRIGGTMVGRFELNEFHRSISIVAMIFLLIHVITTIADSYVSTGIVSVIVPMTSQFKRVGVAVGAISFDLILAVWLSSLIKSRIENRSWRFIHWFSWLAFTAAVVHAYMTGTDAKHGAGILLVIVCSLVVIGSALWRYAARPARASGRTALSPLATSDTPSKDSPTARAFPSDSRDSEQRKSK
jgi:predicted ferric reductase